ncbi:MAG TPA: hypothetical protein VGP44_05590 [Gemmatimonadales bacterium]|nr:hypothetical protein [Gemmatimonadales bacterium]
MNNAEKIRMTTVLTLAALAIPVAGAQASTTVGQTSTPDSSCADGVSYIQTAASTGARYDIPTEGGVITSWSHQAAGVSDGQRLALRVFTRQVAPNFTAVAESTLETISPNKMNTFQVRIPVSGDEAIGFLETDNGNGFLCAAGTASSGDTTAFANPTAVGIMTPYYPGNKTLLDISAVVEPDGDHDGYGDETQDACPGDPTRISCPAEPVTPSAVLGAHPKKRTRSRKAAFGMGSDSPVATFACGIDNKPLTPCGPTRKFKKLKPGKHRFNFRAEAGGKTSEPVVFRWRIKR